jgi:CRP/FNR family transcriptional regulator, cyclic AMP receptor protein
MKYTNKPRLGPLGDLAVVALQVEKFKRRERVYSQGDFGETVFYIQKGGVKLCATTQTGKEAVVAILGLGHFFGEKCLSGRLVRGATAIATVPSTLIVVRKNEMHRVLRTKHPFCDVFISYVLARNLRIEEDLVDNLCNSGEGRLARVLLLLAEQADQDKSQAFAGISQQTLARMIGITRSRVNVFMNRFRKRGFIKYADKYNGTLKQNQGLQINTSLLATVLDK